MFYTIFAASGRPCTITSHAEGSSPREALEEFGNSERGSGYIHQGDLYVVLPTAAIKAGKNIAVVLPPTAVVLRWEPVSPVPAFKAEAVS